MSEPFSSAILDPQLCQAAETGRVDDIASLIRAGADPNMQINGRTLLCHIIHGAPPMPIDGTRDILAALILGGAQLDKAGLDGYTPLMTAVDRVDRVDLIRDLLQKGADPNAMGHYSPLYLAVEFEMAAGTTWRTRLLIEAGADPDEIIPACAHETTPTVRAQLEETAATEYVMSATGMVPMAEFAAQARRLLALLPTSSLRQARQRQQQMRESCKGAMNKFRLSSSSGKKGPRP